MSDRSTCPRCGSALSDVGACPACGPACADSAATRTLSPGDADTPRPTATLPPADPAETWTLADEVPPPLPAALPERIGRFEVRCFLGEGAFGRVYEAYDPQLRRRVALKVAKPERLTTPERVQRFLGEAHAAGELRHPNIVPVYDAGADGPHHYIAYAFIEGRTLEADLAARPAGNKPDLRRAATLVRKLAEALHYAHGKGVVHRDVKPANVMLDESGEPLLMDFGLAARFEDDERLTQQRMIVAAEQRLTQEGMILGTPAYMSPEQAAGRVKDVGPAADQYSLGCVLYELLTGQPPFAGNVEILLFHHLRMLPRSPRRISRRVPRDLEAVSLRCLEKKPGARYASCAAFADDLRRWCDGLPVAARRIPFADRCVRWALRRPLLATLGGLVMVLLLSVLTVIINSHHRETKEADSAKKLSARVESETARAIDAEYAVQRREYAIAIRLMQEAWEEHRQHRFLELLNSQVPKGGKKDPRGFEWYYWKRRVNHQLFTLKEKEEIESSSFSPDGRHLACGTQFGEISVWDTRTRREVMHAHADMPFPVTSVCFSPDGKLLASIARHSSQKHPEEQVRIWNVAAGKQAVALRRTGQARFEPKGPLETACFSPDGSFLAAASGEHPDGPGASEIMLWDAGTGREVQTWRRHTDGVLSVCFSPDGKRLATASLDHTVNVWDLSTGRDALSLKGHRRPVNSICFGCDGERICSGDEDGQVIVWDSHTGKVALTLTGHSGRITALRFSPDGTRLASASADLTTRIWNVATGQPFLILKGVTHPPISLHFSDDGFTLFAACSDSSVKAWDVVLGDGPVTLPGKTGEVTSVSFSPDGKRVMAVSADQTLKAWDAVTGQAVPHPKDLPAIGRKGVIDPNYYSPDGTCFVRLRGPTVELWNAGRKEIIRTLDGHTGLVNGACFSADCSRLATASSDHTLKIWEVETGLDMLTLKGHDGPVTAVCFSPDGKLLASGGTCDPTAHRSDRKVFLPPPHHRCECLWEPPAAAWLDVG